METKNIILKLRTERGMSQDELADKIMVTRQAVSRWENGDTVPNTDTLKLLSKEFDVSINTLLGEPRKLICQCCGMPIDDDSILGRDKDGTLNEEYCKWCYADGTYTYNDMDELIDVCVKNMVNENFTEEQARSYLKEMLPKLDYWKRYDELSDNGQFEEFKKQLINEINDLHIDGLPRVDKLNALVGKYVNLEYTLPNGQKVKFLDDQKTYLGNQLESEFGGDRCFGILAGMDFILVCTYEKNGENPELLKQFDVVLNVGDADTAQSGGENWIDETVITAVKEFVYNGGGFIGVGEPAAHQWQGHFFQLDDVLGVEEENGFNLNKDKYNWEEHKDHFILADSDGEVNFGEGKKNIYALDGTEILIQKDHEVQMAVRSFGKGRGVYISGLPYSFENSRVLYRAVLWSTHSEDELNRWFSTNYNVDVHAYPKNNKYCVVNNTDEPQQTTIYRGDGSSFELALEPNQIIWYEIA